MTSDPESSNGGENLDRPEMQGFHLSSSLDPSEDLLVIELGEKQQPPEPDEDEQERTEAQRLAGEQTATSSSTSRKMEEQERDEKPSPPAPAVGFSELFRFADGLDLALMAIGSVGAVVHGCSLPVFLRFFADLVDSFGSNVNDPDTMCREVVKVLAIS